MAFTCVYELSHHGIKGQKWGVKNGPPYPLKQSSKSKAEKKAETVNKTRETDPEKIVKKYSNTPAKGYVSMVVAYTLTSLAIVAISNIHWSRKKKKEMANHIAENKTNIQKKIEGEHSESEDMAAVNPRFKYMEPEYLSNCFLCTTAYDLRRRGYDVQANATKLGRNDSDIATYYNLDPKKDIKVHKNYSDMYKELESQPDGARGNICADVGPWHSRHSMAWEKQGDNVVIIDAQSNNKYYSIESSIINKNSSSGYTIVRTDDKEINWTGIRDAVVERKDSTVSKGESA